MTVATEATSFTCPGCKAELAGTANTVETRCPACNWIGQVYLFRPLNLQVERAEEALPDDATCAHHPAKQAVAQCGGTGDYICALCSVEVDGTTYSASFLSSKGGKGKLKGAFDRYLPRPDRAMETAIALSFLLGGMFVGIVGIPLAMYYFFKAKRLRREDKIFAEVFSRRRMILDGVILALVCLGIIAVIVALAVS